MDPNAAQQPENPNQNTQQSVQQINQIPEQPNSKSKITLIILGVVVLLVLIVIIVGYFFISNNSDNNILNADQSQNLNNKIINEQENSFFTVKDLRSNEEIIFKENVEISCDPYWKERSTDDLITITVGPSDEDVEEEGNFWVMWVQASDLKEGKQFNLPTGYIGDAEDMNGPTLFLLLEDDLNYSSEAEGSIGTITMHEYKGCEAGSSVSFTIDADLIRVEGAEDQPTDGFAEVKGRFSGNIEQQVLDDMYGTDEERKIMEEEN